MKFGDLVVNTAASESNPIKHCTFLQRVTRTGRMNPGKWIEVMCSRGHRHLIGADSIQLEQARDIVPSDEIAQLRADLAAKTAECERLRGELARPGSLASKRVERIMELEQQLATTSAELATARQSLEVRDTEIERLETDLELARVDAGRATHVAETESRKASRLALDVQELAMLIRNLCYRLNKYAPEAQVLANARAYLERKGLQGSITRDAAIDTAMNGERGGE